MIALDIKSAITARECQALAELAAGRIVLEMGSHLGRSTVALASTAIRVHSVDWHRGDGHASHSETLSDFVANLERHGVRDRVVVHVGRFEDVLPLMRDYLFDLIFLDGFHEQQAVLSDYHLARRHLIPGGGFAFHDYGVPTFGVTEAVDGLGYPVKCVGNLAVIWP